MPCNSPPASTCSCQQASPIVNRWFRNLGESSNIPSIASQTAAKRHNVWGPKISTDENPPSWREQEGTNDASPTRDLGATSKSLQTQTISHVHILWKPDEKVPENVQQGPGVRDVTSFQSSKHSMGSAYLPRFGWLKRDQCRHINTSPLHLPGATFVCLNLWSTSTSPGTPHHNIR